MFNKVKQEAQSIRAETERCLYCVDAPCRSGCPSDVNVPQFIRHIRYDDLKSAKSVIKDSNPLGGVCGYLCPSEDLCQKNCLRAKIDAPIRIRELQKYACDHVAYQMPSLAANGKKVAVIGAGPAGIACSASLARRGVSVDVYDEQTSPGGLINSEIPAYRVSDEVLQKDIRELESENVVYRLGEAVNAERLEKIVEEYDAVFLCTGLVRNRDSGIEGRSFAKNVLNASEFLSSVKGGDQTKVAGIVYVVGGGDAAVDSAETALRCGADRAVLVYRRSRYEMPATDESLFDAVARGAEILYQTSLTAIRAGSPLEVVLVQNRLRHAPGESRQMFEPIPESSFSMKGDMVIFAIGKDSDETLARACFEGGLQSVNEDTLRLDKGKIFAGGDFVNGGKTVVEAVRHGKLAADSIADYLGI